MKENERYELFGEHCIKDNDPDARRQLLDVYIACVILNEQDKHIKELELLLKADKKIKTNSLNGFEKLRQENQQLKEQLSNEEQSHDLYIKSFEEETEKLRKQIKFESDARERFKQENQQLKQQVREEVVKEIRKRLKKANFEIMSPTDPYSYTDNFLYQVEKGETK